LDYVVRDKFEGKKWALPARVYARPLELYAGLDIKPMQILAELKALGYQRGSQLQKPGQFVQGTNNLGIYSRGFSFWDKPELPNAVSLSFAGDTIIGMTDLFGQPVGIIRLEPQEIGGIYPNHGEDRLLVRLQDIPPLLGEALIAVEDRDFLEHHGISLKGIARAMWVNVRSGDLVQGGSTLTQQLVKNFYLNQDRSIVRKALEAVMALSLDAHYGKAEILETYINEVYLGQSGAVGIHGFALASQHYFRQPLPELKLHQLALLVGLVKGASYYNPWRNSERALARRNVVLAVLKDSALISDDEYRQAMNRGLEVVATPLHSVHHYPAFMDLVKRQVKEDYAEEDLRSEGLRIFTTLSPWVQQQSEAALTARLQKLEQDFQIEEQALQGAIVVSAVGSGEVLALVGDRQQRDGFNRALDARRAIGSLVKPAVYLTALQQPQNYTLTTPVDDSEITVLGEGGRLWQPRNFTLESHGTVPLFVALAASYNQATARLGVDVGVDKVIDTLRELGLDREVADLPSVLLGAVDLSPWQVSTLYQTIASEGVYTPQRAILSVMDAQGQALTRYPFKPESRFDPESMHLLHFALQTTMRQGTGRSLYQDWDKDWLVAGKTGTTNDQRDAWFAGFTGDHLAVVWVGRDDNGPMPLTGATGALPVWSQLFTQLASRPLQPIKPRAVNYLWVDAATETVTGENCRGAVLIPYIQGSEPKLPGQCERINSPPIHWLKNLLKPE
jgi:penicillin-binding protein 1B